MEGKEEADEERRMAWLVGLRLRFLTLRSVRNVSAVINLLVQKQPIRLFFFGIRWSQYMVAKFSCRTSDQGEGGGMFTWGRDLLLTRQVNHSQGPPVA